VTIVWSPRAIRLAELRAYAARDNPMVAGRIAATVLDAVDAPDLLERGDERG
jgi:hypothetical protein